MIVWLHHVATQLDQYKNSNSVKLIDEIFIKCLDIRKTFLTPIPKNNIDSVFNNIDLYNNYLKKSKKG